jgi:acyl carrier protein
MIPSVFVILEALPFLPSGKLDRQALPTPNHTRPALDTPFVAPRTPIEAKLIKIWTEVLQLQQVSIYDHFAELGGHSLLATQILSRVVKAFGVDLPVRTLMEAPTVAEMAVVIARHQGGQVDPDTLARLLSEVEELSEEQVRRHLADTPEP